MANQEESPLRSVITSWPALAALMIAVVGYVLSNTKLESLRPTNVGESKQHLKVSEVEARLWQDPLANVLQVKGSKTDTDTNNFAYGMPEIQAGDKVLVLLVKIPLEQNQEQKEVRRRERYAILSALNTAGFVPVQSEYLSFVDIDLKNVIDPNKVDIGPKIDKAKLQPSSNIKYLTRKSQSRNYWPAMPVQITNSAIQDKDIDNNKHKDSDEKFGTENETNDNRIRVPFEWIRPSNDKNYSHSQYGGICVVWVCDDVVPSSPIHSYNYLKQQLKCAINCAKIDVSCEFAITGRLTSDNLAEILTEAIKHPKNQEDVVTLRASAHSQ